MFIPRVDFLPDTDRILRYMALSELQTLYKWTGNADQRSQQYGLDYHADLMDEIWLKLNEAHDSKDEEKLLAVANFYGEQVLSFWRGRTRLYLDQLATMLPSIGHSFDQEQGVSLEVSPSEHIRLWGNFSFPELNVERLTPQDDARIMLKRYPSIDGGLYEVSSNLRNSVDIKPLRPGYLVSLDPEGAIRKVLRDDSIFNKNGMARARRLNSIELF